MKKDPAVSNYYATGGVKFLLRAEGLGVLVAACLAYSQISSNWKEFLWFFFLPDISFFGYLIGKKFGAAAYNTAHSYVLPIGLFLVAYALNRLETSPYLMIWIAHIGFDRALGYGLKYASGFSDTHLGCIQGWKNKSKSEK